MNETCHDCGSDIFRNMTPGNNPNVTPVYQCAHCGTAYYYINGRLVKPGHVKKKKGFWRN